MDDLMKDAYFAGLIDGEGNICLEKRGPRRLRPVIKVNMTCEKTVNSLLEHFQVGTVRPRPKSQHRQQWRWRAQCQCAVDVVVRIYPYLITKKSAAEMLLKHKPLPSGRPRKTPPGGGAP